MAMPRTRRLVLLAPYLWLLTFFLAPFGLVLRLALSESAQALPPYAPHWLGFARLGEFLAALDFANFSTLFGDALYLDAYLTAIRIALETTGLTLLIGFPLAHALANAPGRWQGALVVLVILPFWTSFLIRVYAWTTILRPEGVLNAVLLWAGAIAAPIRILNTELAIMIGMVYAYLPFMVLPIYAALEKRDPALLEAAADLGAGPAARLWRITLPLAMPGVIAGALLVFIPAVGEFVIPDLLGGPDTLMIGKVLWTEFFSNRDWPLASAAAVVLVAILLAPMLLLQRASRRGAAR